MKQSHTYPLLCLQDTKRLAIKVAAILPPNPVLALSGPVGAGKTTWTKAFSRALGNKKRLLSPTYTLIQPYDLPSRRSLVHIDAYRLDSPKELIQIGWQDFWQAKNNIIVIEWAEKIKPLLKGRPIIWLKFSFRPDGARVCALSWTK